MSAHAPTDVTHTEHAHPGARQYIQIALILSVLTALEVGVYYIEALRPILVFILLVLSAVKFALVIGFYMHLKFDHRIFSGMFLFGLGTAGFTIIMLIALFHGWFNI
jgi:cytochrome c oxidase subunit 4